MKIRNLLRTSRTAKKSEEMITSAADMSREYWVRHNVTSHEQYQSRQASLDYFHWRNDQYFNYIALMPVHEQDGKEVLDFGCGPGNDLVGFGEYSKPRRLVGVDVSATSLEQAKRRLALHDINAELLEIDCSNLRLPFADESFDHIHCSGVLHHMHEPVSALREFKRILRRTGTVNVMVYNYESLWLHLYVAYQRTLVQGLHVESDLREQFRYSTDGEECPISRCFTATEFVTLCREADMCAEFVGAAVSMHEAALFPLRFEAIQNRQLSAESRRFLRELQTDNRGYPLYRGHYAGIGGCYRLRRT